MTSLFDAPATATVDGAGPVRRARLLNRLAATTDRPLVVLVAPAGYGKTTALAQWACEDSRDLAWVILDEADNNPGRLLDHLGRALSVLPGMDDGRPALGPFSLAGLRNQLATRARPVLIVVDDVHHLKPGPAADVLTQLSQSLPPTSQLAVAGRTVPPLRLGRLRAEQRCAEFGTADLAFDPQETDEVLINSGIDTSATEVGRLVESTEGWPAGVCLCAISLRADAEPPTAAVEVNGDHAFLADYFRDEMLARQPAETVHFLMRTAVLDQFCAAMCDEVLQTSGSAVQLAEVERRNLFLVPLDHRRQWYRYHRLFAETLIAELRRRDPDAEKAIHLRAADWHEQRGAVERAVRHRLASGDATTAAQAINRYGGRFVGGGRITTVRGWLDALSDEVFTSYPPVAVTAAWVAALSGEVDRAQRHLLRTDPSAFTGPLPDKQSTLEGAISLVRAMMGIDGVERMLADARHALDLEPPHRPWHPFASTVYAMAQLLNGATADAAQRLRRTVTLRRDDIRAEVALALAQLSLLSDDAGEHEAAGRYAREADDLLTGINRDNMVTVMVTDLAVTRAELRDGRPDAARQRLGAALRHYLNVPPAAFPWLAAQAALQLGEISLEVGEVAAARTRLEEARQHLARIPTTGVLGERCQMLQTAVRYADAVSAEHSTMALSEAEARVLRLLPTHLSLAEIGEQLHLSRNTVKSHVTAIYRKLQASNRTVVVARAHELQLLE